MLRRFSSAFLWALPLFFLVFAATYRTLGLKSVLVGGALYFVVVAVTVSQVLKHRDCKGSVPSVVAPGVVLVVGGALEWLTGGVGPPDPAHPAALYFNSVGLLAGWIVVLAGFVLLTAAIWDVADRALSLLGLVGFTLAVGFWTAQRVVLWAVVALPQADSSGGGSGSDLLTALMSARLSLARAAAIAAYAAIAAFAGAMWKCGRLGNVWGPVVIGTSLLLVASHLAWSFALVPPAFVCIFPYFMGVLLLRKAPINEVATTESNLALQPTAR